MVEKAEAIFRLFCDRGFGAGGAIAFLGAAALGMELDSRAFVRLSSPRSASTGDPSDQMQEVGQPGLMAYR